MKYSVILAMLLPFTIFAQTDVSGEVSGVWSRGIHPITLIGDVSVPLGDTLMIESNVEVYRDTFEIRVLGTLLAEEALFFEGSGIFNDNGEVGLNGCIIEGAQYGIKSFGGSVNIVNTLFDGMAEEGLDFHQIVYGKVENCQILDSGTYGIRITQSDIVYIRNNILSGNSQNDTVYPALFIDSSSPQEISFNQIIENLGQGVGIWALTGTASPKLSNNLIQGNFTGITIVNATPILDYNTIIQNFVEDEANSGAGVYIGYADALPILTNNYIAFNYYGVSVINNGQANLGMLVNSPINDDGQNVFLDNSFDGVTWNVWNGTPFTLYAQNNYWPGLDTSAIDATLYDDNEGANGEIIFEPTASLALGKGNLDGDQRISILDIVIMLENVLNDENFYGAHLWKADINDDLEVDINDIVLLIDIFLNPGN